MIAFLYHRGNIAMYLIIFAKVVYKECKTNYKHYCYDR